MTVINDSLGQKLIILAAAVTAFMDSLDCSIVNVVLPVIASDFNVDTGTAAWVTITYFLMLAGLLVVFGRIGNSGFLKNMYLAGFIIFTAGSLLCGLAPQYEFLIFARIMQGLGGAMLAAACPLMLVNYLPAGMMGYSFGILTIASSIAFALGPAIGGFITQFLSWHWIFYLNIPIGIAAVIFAAKIIPPDKKTGDDKKSISLKSFDIAGAALLFIAIAAFTYMLECLPEYSTNPEIIFECGVLSVFAGILFIVKETKSDMPILNLRIFKSLNFSFILTSYLIFNIIYMGVIYLLPFYMSLVMGLDTAQCGLYLLIPPVITMITGISAGKFSDRHGRKFISVISFLLILTESLVFAVFAPGNESFLLLPVLIAMGLLWGAAGGPVPSWIIESASEDDKGAASSLMMTVMYLGGVLGTAVYASIATLGAAAVDGAVKPFAEMSIPAFVSGFHLPMYPGIILAVLTIIMGLLAAETVVKKKY